MLCHITWHTVTKVFDFLKSKGEVPKSRIRPEPEGYDK